MLYVQKNFLLKIAHISYAANGAQKGKGSYYHVLVSWTYMWASTVANLT